MRLCTARDAKALDEYTIGTLGVPSITLMERASSHLAREALRLMGENGSAAVFCGPGNNGGDGVGAAVCLTRLGKTVRVFLVGDDTRMTADTREMVSRLSTLGVGIERFPGAPGLTDYLKTCGAVIDAIYGVGFHPPLLGTALDACAAMNAAPVPVVSADIPSGVEADTGRVSDGSVLADVTVTFTLAKAGELVTPGALQCGELLVRDIGVSVPENFEFSAETFTADGFRPPKRRRDAHKGNFGRCLIVAGSAGYTGAPSFAARAAVRTGAGLVFLGVPESIYTIEAVKNDEAMVFPLPCDRKGRLTGAAFASVSEKLEKASACLVGPGLGLSPEIDGIVEAVLTSSSVPVIVDADGITAVGRNIDILRRAKCPVILTPHDGEFSRLGGDLAENDRLSAARGFAGEYGVTLVLKGYRTLSAFPDGTVYVNTTGNPGMAKGGSGDVLAGMMLALVGQGIELRQAVTGAVRLHGAAGDAAAAKFGECAMTPSDMIGAIADVTR